MESYRHKFTSIHPPPPKKIPSRHHIVTFPPLSCAAVPAHSPARGSVPSRLCVLRTVASPTIPADYPSLSSPPDGVDALGAPEGAGR